jgi:hypothetical protein
MLSGFPSTDGSPDHYCLERRGLPAVFLRLESPRERLALPYASLIKLVLRVDDTALELAFVTHRVTITGRNLNELYQAVTDVEARTIRVVAAGCTAEAGLRSLQALVLGIRIDPLDENERRSR